MINDDRYRNLFEIGPSSDYTALQSRIRWEDNLFNFTYRSALPSERVKYGNMNIVNDPKGILSARSYGQSYFVLKGVRMRTTFIFGDSSSIACCRTIATPEHCKHLLLKLSDVELNEVIKACTGQAGNSQILTTYIEMHIHGNVLFDTHISELHLCTNECVGITEVDGKLHDLAKSFCDKYNIKFVPFN